jgi:hypothetical protein
MKVDFPDDRSLAAPSQQRYELGRNACFPLFILFCPLSLAGRPWQEGNLMLDSVGR